MKNPKSMDEETLMSMGDTGKTNFEEKPNAETTETNDAVTETQTAETTEQKTVADVIKEKEEQTRLLEEQRIAKEREDAMEKKIVENFGWKYVPEKTTEVVETIETKDDGISDNKESIEDVKKKAEEVADAAKRTVEFYENKNIEILSENKTLKTTNLEQQLEIKSLQAKIEEMANDKASKSNNYIETNDVTVRYHANLKKNLQSDPSNEVMKQKAVDYYVDELSILVPHIAPEDLRKVLTKKEEEIVVDMSSKWDYHTQAEMIAKQTDAKNKKADVLRAIWGKKLNYNI